MVAVPEFTLPDAGIDTTEITLEEHYSVEGVGEDTIVLRGTLIADRAAPLIGFGQETAEWDTATVVARFTSLAVSGESDVFGPVHAVLDNRTPSFAAVTAGKCAAAVSLVVSMPQQELTLHTAAPVQLRSEVTTVPPIGDEQTVSIGSVQLLDLRSRRIAGTLHSARVVWRELTAQVPHYIG
jgi:hypothetical protein